MTPGLLDTSVVVRYLTNDPPELGERAARLMDSEQRVVISPVALVETAHVLSKVYGLARETVVDLLVNLLQKDNMLTLGPDKAVLVQGLMMCRPSNRVSFPDAMLWAEARSGGIGRVYSFDRRFPSLWLNVDSLEPR